MKKEMSEEDKVFSIMVFFFAVLGAFALSIGMGKLLGDGAGHLTMAALCLAALLRLYWVRDHSKKKEDSEEKKEAFHAKLDVVAEVGGEPIYTRSKQVN